MKYPTNNLSDKAAAAVRAQQLKGEIKTRLIDYAIDALGGAFPTATTPKVAGGYFMSGDVLMVDVFLGSSSICTKAEFESRKAERQGKPDWKDAPEWAKWLAQDDSGQWRFQSHKLIRPGKSVRSTTGEVIGNWQDTLEQRPEVTKDVNPHKKITKEDLAKAGYIFCGDSFGFVQAKPEPAGADWYDYERRQALKLPPVGVVCEVQAGRRWSKTHVVAHHIDGARAICCDDGFSCGELAYCAAIAFRPLDWDRNKPKVEPVQSPELSFHLATAQNELTSSAKLLPAESKLLQSITGVIAAIQAIREAV